MFGALLVATLLAAGTGNTVVVALYDAAPTDAAHAFARLETARILAAAGVTVLWIELDAPLPPVAPLRVRVVEVRLLDATAAGTTEPPSHAGVLGCTVRHEGLPHHVVLYDDRVRRLVGPDPRRRGRALGRVLAHELVHVLAGPGAHTHRGLMLAVWDESALHDDGAAVTAISRPLAARVRDGATRRAGAGF